MNSKFQKGDRVKVVCDITGERKFIGREGTIVSVRTNMCNPIIVELDDFFNIYCEESELKLLYSPTLKVAKQSFMDKLTTLAKRVVDADLRNMIKVGWLDSRLQLTEEGTNVILADYLNENKEKFGKLAKEELEEKRKDKDE